MASQPQQTAVSYQKAAQQFDLHADRSAAGRAIFILGVIIALAHMYFNLAPSLSNLWQNAIHYAAFACLCVLVYPLSKSRQSITLSSLNLLFGIITAICAIYMVAAEDYIYARGVRLTTLDWICGCFLIVSALEFTRRTTGWIIPALIIISLSYVAWWGGLIEGVFKFTGLSLETLLFRSIYGDDGLFGNIARISSTFVFMFILFGAFLLRSGAGDFIVDFARCLAQRITGGPGIIAVIASGLTGTISGSAIANTASTGVITIPLMKKAGFTPKFSAGVEAAASTGGQLMPPIMGAGAFVMASYTQIPYTTIVAVSILPAILYFFTIGFFVRIEARRLNIKAFSDQPESLASVLREGGPAFLIPIAVLITLLVMGLTPTYAAVISIVAVIVSSWFGPHKMGPVAILDALALGSRNMIMTAILLCAVGLIVNVIATAGIGNTFSLMITDWAGSSLLIALILVGLASLVLGMGLPVTAAYIILGTLSAPALYALITDSQLVTLIASGQVTEEAKAVLMLAMPDKLELIGAAMTIEQAQLLLDAIPSELKYLLRDQMLPPETLTIALLSAHMIIFWLSQDSNVTPPVCLTAFTAAAIAKSKPMETGLQSWKMAKALYFVPLLFAYTPFIGGTWLQVMEIFCFAIVGLYALSAAIQGYLINRLSWPMRITIMLAGAAMLWPTVLPVHIAGAIVFGVIWLMNKQMNTKLT